MKNITVIKSIEQYHNYCDKLEELVSIDKPTKQIEEEIDLLTVLIEKYDAENSDAIELDPVQALKHLMEMHELSASKLADLTGINKTVLSRILNYKKSISKENIRKFSNHFKVNQELFNKPYLVDEQEELPTRDFKSSLRKINPKENELHKTVDSLRIIPSKKSISMTVTIYELISKNDKDLILYIPSLKIYGKGKNLKSAKENLDNKVDKYLKSLIKLSQHKIQSELIKLGWQQNKYKTKNYSNSFIDKNGILKNFEIPVEDHVVKKTTELFAV